MGGSPVLSDCWKTVPGGCTVNRVTSGRRFRGRYAAVTPGQHRRRVAPGVQGRPPLQVTRVGAGDGRARRLGVGVRPRAPRVVRNRGVARAARELDAAARRRHPAPAHRAPAGGRPRVVHLRLVGAPGGEAARRAHDLAGVRGGVPQRAVRGWQQPGHLPGRGLPREHRPRRIARHAVQLAVRPGADDQRPSIVERRVERGVEARPPQPVPQPVGGDVVHGALLAGVRGGRGGGRRRRGGRGAPDDDRGDARGHRDRRHRRRRRGGGPGSPPRRAPAGRSPPPRAASRRAGAAASGSPRRGRRAARTPGRRRRCAIPGRATPCPRAACRRPRRRARGTCAASLA